MQRRWSACSRYPPCLVVALGGRHGLLILLHRPLLCSGGHILFRQGTLTRSHSHLYWQISDSRRGAGQAGRVGAVRGSAVAGRGRYTSRTCDVSK